MGKSDGIRHYLRGREFSSCKIRQSLAMDFFVWYNEKNCTIAEDTEPTAKFKERYSLYMKKQMLPPLTRDSRDYGSDNLRFFLILFVVFAHLLESAPAFKGSDLLYRTIYSFHMPAFLFLLGYYAKYSPKRILFSWAVPYLSFQTLYILFAENVLKRETQLQYTTPYWILWYLLACLFYLLLIPLYDVAGRGRRLVMLAVSVAVALWVGNETTVGYYMSLSRFLVFQPWFLLGFCWRREEKLQAIVSKGKARLVLGILSVPLIALSAWFMEKNQVPKALLYGSYSYNYVGHTQKLRGTVMLIALVWIVFLFIVIKPFLTKKIFPITYIGQNTLPVFLLHGFVLRAIPKFHPEWISTPWKVVLVTLAILLVFGNGIAKKVVYVAGFSWLEKLMKWNGDTGAAKK